MPARDPRRWLDQGFNVLANRKPRALSRTSAFLLFRVAERRTRGRSPQEPPDHPLGAITRCSRTTIVAVARIALVPAILCSLPHVAVDVVEAPTVGVKAINWHQALPESAFGTATDVWIGAAVVVYILRRRIVVPSKTVLSHPRASLLAFASDRSIGPSTLEFQGQSRGWPVA